MALRAVAREHGREKQSQPAMYKKILIAVENATSDAPMLEHVGRLARLAGSEVLLVHVADGWAARNFDELKLAESEEMLGDKAYLRECAEAFRREGLRAEWKLAMGNPPQEILRAVETSGCDLIAMAAHGHKAVGDVLFGSTIARVRHNTTVPVLVIHGGKPVAPGTARTAAPITPSRGQATPVPACV